MASNAVYKVTFVQTNGDERNLEIPQGVSLMEAARNAEIDGILGDCGGSCSCATCHVYVDAQWKDRVGPPDEIEASTLDMVSGLVRDDSRLCCQLIMQPTLDGLRVTVAPSD